MYGVGKLLGGSGYLLSIRLEGQIKGGQEGLTRKRQQDK